MQGLRIHFAVHLRHSIRFVFFIVGFHRVISSCIAQETAIKPTSYQSRLAVLHDQAQNLAKKRYFEARGGPKLTSYENTQWCAVKGELHETDPPWRFERQLVEDIEAFNPISADEFLTQKDQEQTRCQEFLKIVAEMHPEATQAKAQVEVLRLRNAFFINDLATARRISKENKARTP